MVEPSPTSYREFTELRRPSQSFTTIEVWHEVGEGVYKMDQRTRAPSFADRFDPERYHNDRASSEAPSTSEARSSRVDGTSQDGDKSELSEARDSKASEKAYHIFTSRQRWTVVIMIGVAGLFSGLSSNIYFPALDSISKVQNPLMQR